MTAAERAYWLKVHRRAASLTPDLAAAILTAFKQLRDSLSEAELARIIEGASIERIFTSVLSTAVFAQAFTPLREQIRKSVLDSIKYFSRDLPKAGKVGNISFAFDSLNPKVIDAIKALNTRVMADLTDGVRETFRQVVERGLTEGASPRRVARDIKGLIGLAPNQEQAVVNFQKMLEAGDRTALRRQLRDKRFDRTLDRALGADGEGLTAPRVEAMTNAYRRKMIGFNAETHARTATLDSLKLGQRLSINDAVDRGILDGDRMEKTWVGVMDDRERESHVAMEGETVAYDEPFSNGQMIPGENEYNCRCVARYHQRREA